MNSYLFFFIYSSRPNNLFSPEVAPNKSSKNSSAVNLLAGVNNPPFERKGSRIAIISDAQSVTGKESLGSNQSKDSGRRQSGNDWISKEDYEKMKQDLLLKEADNRFLQEELEQKDRMLGMLTEGLKEVSCQ